MTYIKDNSPEKDSEENRKSLVQSTKDEFSLKIFYGENLFNLQISRGTFSK